MEQKKRALVVDDQELISELVAEILEAHGFETEQAADGSQAERILRDSNFDLLITDLLMPDVDGLQLILNLRHKEATKDLKIIAMSGGGRYNTGEFYLKSANKLGADYILAKPFTVAQLLEAVQKLGFTTRDPEKGPPLPQADP